MSNNKQSSVEWLIGQIAEDQMIKAKSLNEWTKIIEQAKAMHKEEIVKAWSNGYVENNFSYFDPEQYYKQTFGGEQ